MKGANRSVDQLLANSDESGSTGHLFAPGTKASIKPRAIHVYFRAIQLSADEASRVNIKGEGIGQCGGLACLDEAVSVAAVFQMPEVEPGCGFKL